MIKCNKGHAKVKGTFHELIAELSIIVKTLHEGLKKDGIPPELAKQVILRAANVALMTEEEREADRQAQKERAGEVIGQLQILLGKDEE